MFYQMRQCNFDQHKDLAIVTKTILNKKSLGKLNTLLTYLYLINSAIQLEATSVCSRYILINIPSVFLLYFDRHYFEQKQYSCTKTM